MAIPRKKIEWGTVNKTWPELTLVQQNAALKLVVLHAAKKYIRAADYARCIAIWQVDPTGVIVGWISSNPTTQAKAPENG